MYGVRSPFPTITNHPFDTHFQAMLKIFPPMIQQSLSSPTSLPASLPLQIYCDGPSGNKSKKWNKLNSFLFTLAILDVVHLISLAISTSSQHQILHGQLRCWRPSSTK